EVNHALLKALILPESLIWCFINHYTSSMCAEIFVELRDRRKQLKKAALENMDFLVYLSNSEQVQKKLLAYIKYLKNFKMTGKKFVFQERDELNMWENMSALLESRGLSSQWSSSKVEELKQSRLRARSTTPPSRYSSGRATPVSAFANTGRKTPLSQNRTQAPASALNEFRKLSQRSHNNTPRPPSNALYRPRSSASPAERVPTPLNDSRKSSASRTGLYGSSSAAVLNKLSPDKGPVLQFQSIAHIEENRGTVKAASQASLPPVFVPIRRVEAVRVTPVVATVTQESEGSSADRVTVLTEASEPKKEACHCCLIA
ncbi:MAG TPA: hypothetical protein VLH77_04350, partial [Gammaproteobacteria bacterium]|nr:hypothetical protein [Gammaproteobacteria bacterium]